MNGLSCTYVTYIEATSDDVWHALTDADITAEFWGRSNVSDWKVGSTWEHRRTDGSGEADGGGKVLESSQPNRLAFTFPTGEYSTVSFDITTYDTIVRLTMTHIDLPSQEVQQAVSRVWPAVLSNLKSLLETARVMSTPPLSTLNIG